MYHCFQCSLLFTNLMVVKCDVGPIVWLKKLSEEVRIYPGTLLCSGSPGVPHDHGSMYVE